MTEYNRRDQARMDKMQADIEQLTEKAARLQTLLNEARGPDGHTHERVAEWLRGQGYTVTKNDPELRFFGEIPL